MNTQIDSKKVRYACIVFAVSFFGSILLKPLVSCNQDAINIIVTVFAILAGFLILVITLVGDTESVPLGSWRIARFSIDQTHKSLIRHKWLFYLYLIILLLIFSSMLIKDQFPRVNDYLEYIYLTCSIAAFILSFKLPSTVIKLQKERLEHEIIKRRQADGIK